MNALELEGSGLFDGRRAALRLARHPGESRVSTACGQTAALSACTPLAGERCTDLLLPSGARLRSVEHWAAAMAGLGLHHGVHLTMHEGDELPLLDGCALAWTQSLEALGIQPSPSRLRVARALTLDDGESRYEFVPAEALSLSVELVSSFSHLAPIAHYDGARSQFRALAAARTFAFTRDLPDYFARGVRPHVNPEQVVLVDEHGVHGEGATPDEPVRHKLLDLLGDLFLHGGLVAGKLRARAPGHAKTHRVMRRALEAGAIALAALCPQLAFGQHRFEPSPLTMPTLVHAKPVFEVDSRAGLFVGDGTTVRGQGALVRHGFGFDIPVHLRRVYLSARYEVASGNSMLDRYPRTSETLSGNTQLGVRSLWIAPGGLALGGALDVTLPTAYFSPDSAAGDVARMAQGLSPNDWMLFSPRTLALRPSFDVRISAAGFTFQLRQSVSFAIGVADGNDSAMVAELGLYVGQQVGPWQIGLEVAELYLIDTLLSAGRERQDSSRARFMITPQLRWARGRFRPGAGLLFSPSSAYDGTSSWALGLSSRF